MALFRGFQHRRERHSGHPSLDKLLQPGALDRVMHRAIVKMVVARPRARQFETRMAARGPAMHHRVGHVGMKLKAERVFELKRLDWEIAALREQFGAGGKLETLAVPVIDVIRPVWAELKPCLRRADRVITDLGSSLGVGRNPRAELPRQHLRAETNPQKWPLLPKRHGYPVDFAADEFIRIVGAHRATENDRSSVGVQRFGKGIAKARSANIKGMPERPQRVADPARC